MKNVPVFVKFEQIIFQFWSSKSVHFVEIKLPRVIDKRDDI